MMMKKSALLLLVLMFATSCKSTLNKENKNIVLEYEVSTRGSFKKVIVKEDATITFFDREGKNLSTQKMDKDVWNNLLEMVKAVDLKSIKDLEAPSNNRASDRVASGKLTVINQESTYVSNFFDHGNPPAAIRKIVKQMIEMAEFEKEIISE
jgi:thioredoxin-related protein